LIALDTNVVVRFLVKDDETQSRRAKKLIQEALGKGDAIFIPDVVLIETVWVLERSYRFPKSEIMAIVENLLAAQGVRFNSSDMVRAALMAFENGRGGFADYFLKEQSRDAGCTAVVTFDRKLDREPGYIVLK
jgi:predicted nucleic-acid-binding protein